MERVKVRDKIGVPHTVQIDGATSDVWSLSDIGRMVEQLCAHLGLDGARRGVWMNVEMKVSTPALTMCEFRIMPNPSTLEEQDRRFAMYAIDKLAPDVTVKGIQDITGAVLVSDDPRRP